MKRLAGYTIIVLGTLTAVIILWQFRAVLLLFFFSLVLASAARPPVRRLVQRGLPLWLAILLTYLFGLALLGSLIVLLGPSLLAELTSLASRAAIAYEGYWLGLSQGTEAQQSLASRLPPPAELYEAIAGAQGELLAQRALGLTLNVTSVLAGFITALVASVYWTADQARFERLWLSLLPSGQRTQARLIWREIEDGMGAYIRSEVAQSYVAIVLLYVGFGLIGLPYPALLAVLGGLAWLVPMVGIVFTVVPVLVVGLMESVGMAAMAVLYAVAILLVLEVVVEPRLFNRRRYSSILMLLVMLALVEDFGVLGLIIAPPLAAAIQILFSQLLAAQKPTVFSGASSQLAQMRERLTAVTSILQDGNDADHREISSIATRLDKLLRSAELMVQDEAAT